MGYLTWILGLLGAIVLGLVKDEISAWIPRLARWCVCRAADRMPDRERWREEWLAHLDDRPGKLGQLAHALGVLGIGQARRVRFWIGVLRFLPGIRWTIIDGVVTVVGMAAGALFLFSWYASSDLAWVFATTSTAFAALSYFAERRAAKLLPLDKEMIDWARAQREARDR